MPTVVQEVSLLAGNKLQRHASEDLSGMAQFSSSMSMSEDLSWSAKFGALSVAASMPMPPVR